MIGHVKKQTILNETSEAEVCPHLQGYHNKVSLQIIFIVSKYFDMFI